MYKLTIILLILASSWASAELPNPLPVQGVVTGKTVGLTEVTVCSIKWGTDPRFVTPKMYKQVLERDKFNVNNCPDSLFQGKEVKRAELDHAISRELGGADDISNLWYECYENVQASNEHYYWGAHTKDKLENRLHKEVCDKHTITLEEAQNCIYNNWIQCYKNYYRDHK